MQVPLWHDDISTNKAQAVTSFARVGRTRRLPRAFSADVWSHKGWVTCTFMKLLCISWSIWIWWIYIYIYIHTLSAIWPRSWYVCIWSYGGSWGWRELSKTAIWSRLSEEPMRRKFSIQVAFSSIILEESTLRIVRSLCINLVHLLIVSLRLHMSELSLMAAMSGSWEASSMLWQSVGALEHHQQKV